MGASVTESVSGGIASVQDSVTQVSDHLRSIMMRNCALLMKVLVIMIVTSKLFVQIN